MGRDGPPIHRRSRRRAATAPAAWVVSATCSTADRRSSRVATRLKSPTEESASEQKYQHADMGDRAPGTRNG
jgi:hypothetical protein